VEGTLSLFDWRPDSLVDPGPGHVPSPAPSAPKAPKNPKARRVAQEGAAGPAPQRAPGVSNGNDVPPVEAAPEARAAMASPAQPIDEPGTARGRELAQGSGPTAVVAGRPAPRIVVFDCETTGTTGCTTR